MKRYTRRRFLSTTTAGTVAAFLGGYVDSASSSPNDQIAVALIGINGIGMYHVRQIAANRLARVVALCDVDDAVLARGVRRVKEMTGNTPQTTRDYRTIIDDKSIDAMVIATPHHWHCPIAVPALLAGKDVYVEKPASHVFQEGRLLVDAARKNGRIVQHGTQMRSSRVTAEAAEVLKSGILGDIKITKAWNVQDRGFAKPVSDSNPPAGVDYDRWLGPAKKRPFNRNRFHGTWRLFREYGNGDFGDDGAHDLDMAAWALGVAEHPVRITAHGSNVKPPGYREFPDNMNVSFEFADGRVLIYEEWRDGQIIDDRLLDVGTTSKRNFGSVLIHLEFCCPFMPTARGMQRGNSGIYVKAKWEVQIIDSFAWHHENRKFERLSKFGRCGGINEMVGPRINMSFPPLTWQTYDIEFTMAKFDDSGKKIAPAMMTVLHNGVVIHDKYVLPPAPPEEADSQSKERAKGPIFLQDHGNPVRYRNIWVVERE